MRDSLTVLAILLIGLLTAALVGPYVVDWDSHRALIERRLSEAAGTPVTVAGRIDLKLLPRPIMRLARVTVGAGRPVLTVAELDAELSITALMRGQVQVVETTLLSPRLDLAETQDGSFNLPWPSDEAAARVQIENLLIRDGALAVALADGRRFALAGIDLDGEATTLRGPFKATGRRSGDAAAFRLAAGATEHGRLRVKVHLDGSGLGPAVDLDGTVDARGAARGVNGPAFEGTVDLAGNLPLAGTPATVPWHLTAHLAADRDGASAREVELRAGADARALIAGGDGSAAFRKGVLPSAALRLHGAGLDLDRLAVAPANSDIAPPGGPDLLPLLLGLAGDGTRAVSLPLTLDIAAGFDTVTVGTRTLLGATAALGLGPAPTAALALSVEAPEGARVALDGRLEPARDRAAFRGHLDVRAADLAGTAAWLTPIAPVASAWLAAVPARGVKATGDLDASAAGVAGRNLALEVDGSRFGGTVSLTRAVGAEPARLFADLSSEGLDLDRLPDLSGAATATRGLDLDLALAARAVTLPSAATGPITAGHLALRLTRTGEDLRLQRFALDVGGGAVAATAARSGGEARADIHLTAPQLGPFADILARVAPGPVAALLRGRASALSPVDASLHLDAAATPEGALTPTRAALDGTLGGTRVVLGLTPDQPDDAGEATRRAVTLSLRAETPEATDLLRQFGLPVAPVPLGSGRLDARARGSVAAGFTGDAQASFAGVALSYAGRAGPGLAATGRLTLASADLRPLLAVLALAPKVGEAVHAEGGADLAWADASVSLRGLTARLAGAAAAGDLTLDLTPRRPGGPVPTTVTGRLAIDRLPADILFGLALGTSSAPGAREGWASAPFGPPPATLPRGEVALSVAAMPLRGTLVARDVGLTLREEAGAVTLADVAGRIADGTFGGTLVLRRDGPAATLSGRTAWTGVGFDLDGLSGHAGGMLDLAAGGDSPAALVASLGGTGRVTLGGAALAHTDPAAPARTATAIEARDRGLGGDAPPLDPEAIRAALAVELGRAALPLGDGGAPAVLAGGVLRAGPFHVDGPAAGADATLALDLDAATLTTRARLRGGPAVGEVVATLAGPLGGGVQDKVDATAFVEVLQARALARAQDRIDVAEQDIRERAFFNRRLKAVLADQQAARERARAEAEAAVAKATAEAAARAEEAARALATARAEAEARRAELVRQKAEDARMQAQVQAAARAEAETQKQRLFEDALKRLDAAPAGTARPRRLRVAPADPSDPPPPPSILQEPGKPPRTFDPSEAGRY